METRRLLKGEEKDSVKNYIIHNMRVNKFGNYISRKEYERVFRKELQSNYSYILLYGKGGVGKSAIVYNVLSKLIEDNNC